MSLQVQRVPIDSVSPDPANVRLHPERNLQAITASLRRFGQQKPIVVDKHGVVRAGNGTLAAAKALGWTEIDVVVTNLEGVDATAFAIADNRTAELAEWDVETLERVLLEFDEETQRDLAFTADDLAAMKLDVGGDGSGSEPDGQLYTPKIMSPIYTPKSASAPPFKEMVDRSKTDRLLAQIDSASLPEDVAAFLRFAAERHTVFHFANIAEFYSHADEATQRLMENSGLVIVDWDKAVESGFVKMTDETIRLASESLALDEDDEDE